MRKSVLFVSDKSETSRGVVLPDGRIVSLCDENNVFYLRYDTKFNLTTGEIMPDDASGDDIVSLNHYIQNGVDLPSVQCYEEVHVDLDNPRKLTKSLISKIKKECSTIGVNVTTEAIEHQFESWRYDFKSGYRDEENGYHLFSPCGCNPFSICCSTLHEKCADWQTTYHA